MAVNNENISVDQSLMEQAELAGHSTGHGYPITDYESNPEPFRDAPKDRSYILPVEETGSLRRRNTSNFTVQEENAVVRKLDRNLTLFLTLLYLLSFLDRSNIGNARIAGLTEDLSLSSSQYEWLLTAFYITYITFEWMALLYRVVPAHIYITLCVFFWGLVASLQSIATSFETLFALRALLGIAEAAFGPGVPFYLSFFFKQEELALRVGLFISAAPLSTSFASYLAWIITSLTKDSSIASWRCLFLIEGFPSVIVAVFAWSIIPDSPQESNFLSPRERKIARARLETSESKKRNHFGKDKLTWRVAVKSLTEPKTYVTAMMFFCCNVAFASMPVFLPTIVNEMGYDTTYSQGLSSPPYIFAFFFTILVAYLSDRAKSRSVFVCASCLFSACGYGLTALTGWYRLGATWRYVGLFPATAGFFAAITIIISWTMNMHERQSERGIATAVLQIIGQCGPLLGTRLYPDSDKPYYVQGMSICCGFMLAVSVLSLALRIFLKRENKALQEKYNMALEEETSLHNDATHATAPRFYYLT